MINKILFITPTYFTVTSFLTNHINILSKNNIDFEIVTNTSELNKYKLNFNEHTSNNYLKFKHINFKRNINIIIDLLSLIKLFIFLKKNKKTIIYTIGPKTGLLVSICGIFLKLNHIHYFTGQVWSNKKNYYFKFLLKNIDKFIANRSNYLLTDSHSQKKFLIDNKILDEYKIEVLGKGSISGVNLSKFSKNNKSKKMLRNELNISEETILILFIGRINIDKGVIDLVSVYERLKKIFKNDIALLIVGPDEGNLLKNIKKNLKEKNLKNVFFRDYTPNPEIYYSSSDIFCLPSYREGFGTSIIEAGACEIPVIGSNIYGLIDSIENNYNGILFNAGDQNDLFLKLKLLIESKSLRHKLGKNGLNRAKKFFSSELVSLNFFEYTKICLSIFNNNSKSNSYDILIVGTSAHSLWNFRGDLIKSIIKSKRNILTVSSFGTIYDQKNILENGSDHINKHIINSKLTPFNDIRYIFFLIYLYFKYNPKVIISYTIKAVIYSGIANFIFSKNFYPIITGIGNNFIDGKKLFKQKITNRLISILYRISIKRSNLVFFQNNDDKIFFQNYKIINSANKVKIINGSGVNLSKYKECIFPKQISFTLASRIIKNKGIEDFFAAANIISKKYKKNIKFIIAGKFEDSSFSLDKNYFFKEISKSNIEFLGWIENQIEFMNKTSVYILPSSREGTPRSILEAMASSKPIITYDVPGCRETVQDRYNGFLCEKGDIKSLVEKIEFFINNPEKIISMGLNSLEIVKKKYDVNSVNMKIINELNYD